MKERFEGGTGRALLLEALQKQDIVRYDKSLAEALADKGEILAFEAGTDIVRQDAADNDVFFLLAGEANVVVNERFVGARAEGTCVGEMAALDPTAPRSATARAKSVVVALKVPEPAFRAACEAHPLVFKALAQLVSQRLRQRSAFVQPPNPQPVLFIGSSTEALPIANELQAGFKHDKFDAIIWKDGVFGPGGVAFDSLAQLAGGADFAAFIISPDDTVISREEEKLAPRDNVIFELGLFMGVLDRPRVFPHSRTRFRREDSVGPAWHYPGDLRPEERRRSHDGTRSCMQRTAQGNRGAGRALNGVEGHTRSGSRDDFPLVLNSSRRRQGARSGGSEARE